MTVRTVIEHKILPQFIELHKRYQCRQCKDWIFYSEGDGKWHHMRDWHGEQY